MEKNIAALMREDTRTVHVSFDAREADADHQKMHEVMRGGAGFAAVGLAKSKSPTEKVYTYITTLPLAIGDFVVVPAAEQMKVACVRRVDDSVTIEPNSDIKYAWVLCKVDLTLALADEKRNKEIEEAVGEAYKANLRRSFANTVMAGLDDASKERIAALIGGPKE
jgi:hypothetical protein